MSAKFAFSIGAAAFIAAICTGKPAEAQGRYYGRDPYGAPYGYSYCVSGNEINARLANAGFYPLANVGGTPDGRYIYMRVNRGGRVFVVTVDCSGRIVR